jgi:hypothetical protein
MDIYSWSRHKTNNKVRKIKMKKITLKTIGSMMLAVLLAAAFAQIPVFAQKDWEKNSFVEKDDSSDNKSIVGVWQTTVTPVNCQTGAPEFQGLSTYNSGGTYTESSGGGNPTLRSAGHGIWERKNGWRNYTLKFIFLRFSPTGVLIGKQRVFQTLELSENGDQLTSSGRFEVLDLNGNVLGSGCSTATATRFE